MKFQVEKMKNYTFLSYHIQTEISIKFHKFSYSLNLQNTKRKYHTNSNRIH